MVSKLFGFIAHFIIVNLLFVSIANAAMVCCWDTGSQGQASAHCDEMATPEQTANNTDSDQDIDSGSGGACDCGDACSQTIVLKPVEHSIMPNLAQADAMFEFALPALIVIAIDHPPKSLRLIKPL